MEVLSVYSTKLNNNRFIIPCIVVSSVIRRTSFVVDTGAMFTCCHYANINSSLKQKDVCHSEKRILSGFVKGSSIIFYKYKLKQLTIGNIDLGEQCIWITFDNRVSDFVLGLDLLKQTTYFSLAKSNCLSFFQDSAELLTYLSTQ